MRNHAAPREDPSEIGAANKAAPEWKQQVFKQSVSFGKRTTLSIKVRLFVVFWACLGIICVRNNAKVCRSMSSARNFSKRSLSHKFLSLLVKLEVVRRRKSRST